MSETTKPVKATEIDGDVAIGRHVTVGGDALLRGSSTIGGDLTVEGWLIARNIKTPDRGLFITPEQLNAAYPNPKDGGWAIVGSVTNGEVYMAANGKWVPTGEHVSAIGDEPATPGNRVLFFDEFDSVNVLNSSNQTADYSTGAAPDGHTIVWCSRDHRFYGKFGTRFYPLFVDWQRYGELNGKGITGIPGVLYVCASGERRGESFVYSTRTNSRGEEYYDLVSALEVLQAKVVAAATRLELQAVEETAAAAAKQANTNKAAISTIDAALRPSQTVYVFDSVLDGGAGMNPEEVTNKTNALCLLLNEDVTVGGIFVTDGRDCSLWAQLPAEESDVADFDTQGWARDPRLIQTTDKQWRLKPNQLFFVPAVMGPGGPTHPHGYFYLTDAYGNLLTPMQWGQGLEVDNLRKDVREFDSRIAAAGHVAEAGQLIDVHALTFNDGNPFGSLQEALDALDAYRREHDFYVAPGAVIKFSMQEGDRPECWVAYQWRKGFYDDMDNDITIADNWELFAPRVQDCVMTSADKRKLDALPAAEAGKSWSTYDFNAQWLIKLANAGVYGREANTLRATNGVFALTKDAPDEQIRAALTEYQTKAVLTRSDLEYCAANGCALWDEQTQGFVHVTHNGGGMFNLMELSMKNYTELPRLRFVGLRVLDDGTWAVTRPGQEERICYKSELDELTMRVVALELAGSLNQKGEIEPGKETGDGEA